MFVIDGQEGYNEIGAAGNNYTMVGQILGLQVGWQNFVSIQALDFMDNPFDRGTTGFIHSGKRVNVLFADWHVASVYPYNVTYDMFENP